MRLRKISLFPREVLSLSRLPLVLVLAGCLGLQAVGVVRSNGLCLHSQGQCSMRL